MKTLFIAEKPSVAKEYADMLTKLENQSFNKNQGYFESSNYYITWCYGHLISLAEPSDYGWTDWDIDKLPMIPNEWKYNVKNDSGVKAQFKVIKSLIQKSSSIVNGADPDREGELIVRLLLHVAQATNIPLFRFWNRSMTYKDLSDAWINKSPGSKYNNLYSSASCRQRADWLIGMNLSRAYSIKSSVKGLSIGRVQTPTLALIVQRDIEIENWVPSFFAELLIEWQDLPFTYIGNDPKNGTYEFETYNDINTAQQLLLNLKEKQANIFSNDTKNEISNAPLFYNLADLQKDANNKYGYSADKSLSLVQLLYEQKLLSYPRTDCNYQTEEMYSESHDLMIKLNSDSNFLNYLNNETPKAFNSNKVTAHTALVPVAILSTEIPQDQINIYNLVKDRFIKAFGKPKSTALTTVILKETTTDSYFKITHRFTKDLGWSYLETAKEESAPFPNIINGNTNSPIQSVQLIEKERSKPKHYTDATIITAMENIAKQIDTEELKSTLKQKGIGTPATRSGILEQLKKREYIELKGKNLISTPKGRSLIKVVHTKTKSPEMTAEWEQQLEHIEKGEVNWKEFYNNIVNYTNLIVTEVKNTEAIKISSGTNSIKCPDCNNSTLVINSAGAFCNIDKGGCGLKVFKTQYGKKLSDKLFNELLIKKTTSSVKLKNKLGKEYSAKLSRNQSTVNLIFK